MTVSEKLRLVQGLHSHAEMFGFKWDDDSDWTWHDVACKIADEVDAENAKLREERREYQATIDSLVDECADYKAENAKLRKDNDRLIQAIEDLHNVSLEDELVQLENENDKLRELVKEMRVCLEDECKRCHEWGDACDLEHQMRELGIEVEP